MIALDSQPSSQAKEPQANFKKIAPYSFPSCLPLCSSDFHSISGIMDYNISSDRSQNKRETPNRLQLFQHVPWRKCRNSIFLITVTANSLKQKCQRRGENQLGRHSYRTILFSSSCSPGCLNLRVALAQKVIRWKHSGISSKSFSVTHSQTFKADSNNLG